MMQIRGGASQNAEFIPGEYNIYTLPDFAEYDGIVVELVNMVDQNVRERILNRVRSSRRQAVVLFFNSEILLSYPATSSRRLLTLVVTSR